MKEYKNVINKRILYQDEDPSQYLVDLVPIPELHILLGIATKPGKVLLKLWPGFTDWLDNNYIMFRSYHGCSFDGNDANRLDQLELDILAAVQLDALQT